MNASKGQALIELVLTISIAAVFLVSLTTAMISAREGFANNDKHLAAELKMQNEVEAIRSIRETNWNSLLTPGTYHTEQTGENWILQSGTFNEDGFTRSFSIENVCRSTSISNIVNCTSSEAKIDPSIKKITVTIEWAFLGSQNISTTFYLSRYVSNDSWIITTQSDFNTGNHNCTVATNNQGGEITLAPVFAGNWSSPSQISSINLAGNADALDIYADCAKTVLVTSSRNGADFFIYNTTNPASPSLTGSLDLSSTGYSLKVINDYSFVASNHDNRELTIINQISQSSPSIAGFFDTPTSADARGIDNSGNNVFIVTNNNTTSPGYEFYSISVTNPSTPVQIGGLDLGNAARDVFVSGNFAFVASTSNTQELQIVNISNPSSPTLAGTFNAPGNNDALSVYVRDNTTFLASGSVVYILNTTNPANISQIGSFNAGATINSVLISGNLAFVGNNQVGSQLKIFNIAIPASPALHGSSSIGGDSFGLSVFSDHVFLSTGSDTAEFQIFHGGNGSGGYKSSGTYETSTFDSQQLVSFNYLNWNDSKPLNTNLKFQIASNENNTSWNYVGPDGTSDTYFDDPGAIDLNHVKGRYFRIKVYLFGDGVSTPTLLDTLISFSL